MTNPILRLFLALTLLTTLALTTRAQVTGQDSDANLIVGSTEQTAATGYTHQQTLWHLANIDHRRWDVNADETMRFLISTGRNSLRMRGCIARGRSRRLRPTCSHGLGRSRLKRRLAR